MPFDKRGRITLDAAVRWVREHERRERPRIGASEANERRAAAEAELAELKLARERGEVVPAADVLAQAEEEVVRVAGVLSQMASEFAPLVAAELGCPLRRAAAVLRKVSDGVRGRLAAPDAESEGVAA